MPYTQIGCVITSLLLQTNLALAGQGVIYGDEEQAFVADRYSVILATVEDVGTNPDTAFFKYRARLRPFGTLAGTLEPARWRTMDVVFESGTPTTSIRAVPVKGAKLLVVVLPDVQVDAKGTSQHMAVSAVCAFMPEGAAMVSVNGFDDPLIQQTLERIQEAHQRGAERRRATTRPASQP